MKKILFVSTLLINFLCSGQSLNWVNQLNSTTDDPSLSSGNITSSAIETDDSGNVYSAGYFSGMVDFDPGPDTVELESNFHLEDITNTGVMTKIYRMDIFIQKNDSDGNLVWVKQLNVTPSGMNQNISSISDIAIDNNGNIYSTGWFSGTIDFDPNIGTSLVTGVEIVNGAYGASDMFIHKLDSYGNFVWVKSFGGMYTAAGRSIDIDENNDILVTGIFTGTLDLNPNAPVNITSSNGFGDVFVQKYNSNGDQLWSKHFGDVETDRVFDIKVQNSNNIYISGTFKGNISIPTTNGTANLVSTNERNGYVIKLNGNGDFVWAERIGDISAEVKRTRIAVDINGSVYVTGGFKGQIDFNNGNQNNTLISAIDTFNIFFLKLNNNGNFEWVNKLDDIFLNSNLQVHLDKMGFAYIIANHGLYLVNNFIINADNEYMKISRYKTNGNFDWNIDYENTNKTSFSHADVDSIGNIFICGTFKDEVNFDQSTNQGIVSLGVPHDVFILKLNHDVNAQIEQQTKTLIKIFPNPSNGNVTIQSTINEGYDALLTIINYSGQIVYRSKLYESINQIDLSHLTSGMYIANITLGSKEVINTKLILEN